MKVDFQRAVQLRIPKMDAEPRRYFRATAFICDEYQNFATVGGDNPTGDERFLSISRQPKCISIIATQSVSSLKDALPNEGVKTLLQAFRTKVFLTTSDPDTARFASELCGKADRTRISYTVSESTSNANVGWLSGRISSGKGSISASKQYQKHKEALDGHKIKPRLSFSGTYGRTRMRTRSHGERSAAFPPYRLLACIGYLLNPHGVISGCFVLLGSCSSAPSDSARIGLACVMARLWAPRTLPP